MVAKAQLVPSAIVQHRHRTVLKSSKNGAHVNSKQLIIGAVMANIIALVANFPAFLPGRPPTVLNKITTALYIAAWLLLLAESLRMKEILFAKSACVYWGAAFIFGTASCYASLVDMDTAFPALPLIVMLTPLYGLLGLANPYELNFALFFIGLSAFMLLMGAGTWIQISSHIEEGRGSPMTESPSTGVK